jgi:SAM-dependent methyltransferase
VCGTRPTGPLRSHTDFPQGSIYRCPDCAHFFCWPEPDAATLQRHYEREYSEKRHAYLGRRYAAIMKKRAEAQAAFLSRWVSPGRSLDVGCGIGALVARLHSLGWSARGIDSDPQAIEFGKRSFRADISTRSLEHSLNGEEPLDLVCLSHVVEHMVDVTHSLAAIGRTVRLGGLVFVEVPNQTSPPEGDMESHVNFFSKRSLIRVMNAAGLEVVACECCGPLNQEVSQPSTRSLAVRFAGAAKRAWQWTFGATDWDGWYDRYHSGDEGVWIRCAGIRRV